MALVRNRAAALGIREINQRNEQLLFYFEHIDPTLAVTVASALKGRVLFSAGAKPYLSVRLREKDEPIDVIRETLDAAEGL